MKNQKRFTMLTILIIVYEKNMVILNSNKKNHSDGKKKSKIYLIKKWERDLQIG